MRLSRKENHSEQKQDFSDIILSEEETEEALRRGREEKHYQLKRAAYAASVDAPREIRVYTFEQLFEIVSKELTIDADNQEIFRLLCMYFTGDERFELEGYSFKKGICLFGGVGVGKTTILKMLCRNQVQSYVVKMCRAVEDEFSKQGDDVLAIYGTLRQTANNSDPFGHQVLGYCFDDLGTEPMGKHYGKETNVMAEVLLNRYDNDLPFHCTHITTNLAVDEIKARYGTRVTDRMRQMFNLLTFPETAKSRRV